ncbi:MAG TPA: ribonuclease E activity regulator RraA [Quisquiliibacterium sp.]|nr:ribonuclease E activity regulator RraA [Quisquiliibacterium sp.]HQN11462.1 ribonuclease E activity regulator RraA [Quisquiliibacterium sp.]
MTLKTSDLCDACDGARASALAWRGYGRRRAFAGTIRTIRCHEDIGLMRAAVGQAGHGQVLVIDGGGSLARALFGDVMAEVAMRNGWAGLVIHGAIRDSVEIDAMDIGVKALGTVPRRGERTGAGEADVPVTFGGVTFTPGHRLVADDDGVIVLPAGLTEDDIDVAGAVAATAAYAATAPKG